MFEGDSSFRFASFGMTGNLGLKGGGRMAIRICESPSFPLPHIYKWFVIPNEVRDLILIEGINIPD